RKLLINTAPMLDGDDSTKCFPFDVIVDSLEDMIAVSEDHKLNLPVKEEVPENAEQKVPSSQLPSKEGDPFEELFNSSPRIGPSGEPNWVPLVSYSSKWRAPDDPKELNKSLYVLQPCIPKFESASRTVKM